MNIEEIRKQAQDENTNPEVLTELANSEDSITRQYVAANPNTPTKILFQLGAEFPRELLDNPIMDLLFLENPYFLSDIPLKTLRSLIKQDNIQESFLRTYVAKESNNTDSLFKILMNPTLSRNVLKQFMRKKPYSKFHHNRLEKAAKLHVNWSGEITEGYDELVLNYLKNKDEYHSIKGLYGEKDWLAWGGYRKPLKIYTILDAIPDLILDDLSRDLYSGFVFAKEMLIVIADSSNTKPEIVDKLAASKNLQIRIGVARNLNTSILGFKTLLEDKKRKGKNRNLPRRYLANNPNLTRELIEILYKDRDADVRKSIANHPNTPSEILEQLAYDRKDYVRCAVANNPNTSIKTLRQIVATEKDKHILQKLANNPNLPLDLMEQFIEDLDWDIQGSILSNPNLPTNLLECWFIVRTKKIDRESYGTTNPNYNGYYHPQYKKIYNAYADRVASYAPIWLMEKLLKYAPWGVSINPDATEDILEKLLDCFDLTVAENLAKHPNTSKKFLTTIANNPEINYKIKVNLVQNPNLPISALLKLLSEDTIYKTIHDIKEQLWNRSIKFFPELESNNIISSEIKISPDGEFRDLSEELLYEISSNEPIKDFLFIAQHLEASEYMLEQLARDNNPIIRYTVANNPNITEKIIALLSTDIDIRIRQSIALNSSTNLKTIKKLVLDKLLGSSLLNNRTYDRRIMKYAILYKFYWYYASWDRWNNRTIEYYLKKNPEQKEQYLSWVLEEYVKSKLDLVRLIALLNPKMCIENLIKYSNSFMWLDRYAVAKNTKTPLDVIQNLTKDANIIVRAAANDNLKIRNKS